MPSAIRRAKGSPISINLCRRANQTTALDALRAPTVSPTTTVLPSASTTCPTDREDGVSARYRLQPARAPIPPFKPRTTAEYRAGASVTTMAASAQSGGLGETVRGLDLALLLVLPVVVSADDVAVLMDQLEHRIARRIRYTPQL